LLAAAAVDGISSGRHPSAGGMLTIAFCRRLALSTLLMATTAARSKAGRLTAVNYTIDDLSLLTAIGPIAYNFEDDRHPMSTPHGSPSCSVRRRRTPRRALTAA
jgi:hypothetical protein